MQYSYNTQGTCSTTITFTLDGGIVRNVRFFGGCPGNLKAIPILVEGMTPAEIREKLAGIDCAGKGTSCADQLAKAVTQAEQEEKTAKARKTEREYI